MPAKRFLVALIALALPVAAIAQSAESPWRVGFALGYGERSNPLVESDDIPIAVDLDLAWFGERFFFDNGDLGYTIADGATGTVNVVARFTSDRVFFSKVERRFVSLGGEATQAPPSQDDVPVEPPDRDHAVEVGIEALLDGQWGELSIATFYDVSQTHDGYEFSLDYSRGARFGRFYVKPSVGFAYNSGSRNDYYWGVRPEEATIGLPEYRAGNGLNVSARLRGSYYFSKNLGAAVSVSYERLAGEITDSPLVDESGVLGYFAGVFYRF